MGEARLLYNSDMLYHLNYNMGIDYMHDCSKKLKRYIDDMAKKKRLGINFKMFITCHNVDTIGRTGYLVLDGKQDLLSIVLKERFFEVKIYKVKDKIAIVFIRDKDPVQVSWIVELKRNVEGLDNRQLVKRWAKQDKMKRSEKIKLIK